MRIDDDDDDDDDDGDDDADDDGDDADDADEDDADDGDDDNGGHQGGIHVGLPKQCIGAPMNHELHHLHCCGSSPAFL